MRSLFLTAPLLLTACTSVLWPEPLHELKRPLRPGEWAWCLAPTGETVGWDNQGGQGYVGATCDGGSRVSGGQAANRHHNRFVLVHACREGEVPANETPAALAERVRLSRDNSLVGDQFEGKAFCAPRPPS